MLKTQSSFFRIHTYTYTLHSFIFLVFITITSGISLNKAKNLEINRNTGVNLDIPLFKQEKDAQEYYDHLESFSKIYHSTKESTNPTTSNLIEMEQISNLGLHKELYSLYVGYIFVGSPPQIVPVTFDTGSGLTWIASSLCISNKECLEADDYYDHTLSKTFRPTNIALEIEFGTGKLSANFGYEVIALSVDKISLNEPIGEITHVDDQVQIIRKGISGIIGLAYNTTTYFNHTLFDGLIESKSLSRNVVAFYFDGLTGQINLGYINANNYKGELNAHPVIDKFYWTIALDDIRFNNESINLCGENICKAIIDTGSTGVVLPLLIYSSLTKNIKVNPDCSDISTLPVIKFIINKIEYVLTPSDYIFKGINLITKKLQCALNIIPFDIPRFKGSFAIILGNNFIQKYYTVFDRDSDSVHFALKK